MSRKLAGKRQQMELNLWISALNTLITALKTIGDHADSVLRKVEQSPQQRSLAWKCAACGHIKHFTRPALAEVAVPMPEMWRRDV
jgi:hypothetical protein